MISTENQGQALKPVLVLQHQRTDSPAYLATWLRRHGVPFEVLCVQAGDRYPDNLQGYAAMAILGGEMSANDDLPMLRQAELLILQAVERGLPVIGHCLGGQLMARALGACVGASPAPEVGWQPLQVLDNPQAQAWLGEPVQHRVVHWHYEAFDLPPGATLLAGSAACPHQAFAIGPHLAMQFHIEADAPKLQLWSQESSPRYREALHNHRATVQSGLEMRNGINALMPAHHALADRIYQQWFGGVAIN